LAQPQKGRDASFSLYESLVEKGRKGKRKHLPNRESDAVFAKGRAGGVNLQRNFE
jgi:hypothetical protein